MTKCTLNITPYSFFFVAHKSCEHVQKALTGGNQKFRSYRLRWPHNPILTQEYTFSPPLATCFDLKGPRMETRLQPPSPLRSVCYCWTGRGDGAGYRAGGGHASHTGVRDVDPLRHRPSGTSFLYRSDRRDIHAINTGRMRRKCRMAHPTFPHIIGARFESQHSACLTLVRIPTVPMCVSNHLCYFILGSQV